MHFLVSSLAPLVNTAKDNHALKFGGAGAPASSSASAASSSSGGGGGMGADPRVNPLSYGASKSIDAMFTTLFQPESHLVKVNPRAPGRLYLACGLFGRGADLGISDMNRNISRLRRELHMSSWNEDGFKIGLCSTPPVGLRNSLLCLSNTTAIAPLMVSMRERCMKMYSRRANFHHYTEYMEADTMDRALATVEQVIADYTNVERESMAATQAAQDGLAVQRIKPLG
jgi:tubulin epsilon